MQLTSDWHNHSIDSCDDACMKQAEFLADAAECGMLDFGITDHLHTQYNMPDVEASRKAYDALGHHPHYHFGIEVSCVSQWELDEVSMGKYDNPVYGLREGGPANTALAIGLTAEDIERLGIEYVVGGTHWPMYCPIEREAVIRDYHRQNMFLVTHPLITIVAHPWWWMGAWKDDDGMYRTDPWLDDFGRIPQSMHEEFAAAARQFGKVVEVNIEAMLIRAPYPASFVRQYLEYLVWMSEAGVQLSIGSDCHSPRYAEIPLAEAASMLESAGLKDETFWRLPRKNAV